ncbi:MAG: phosphoribosylformylglycinamidine synthase subunit PurL [Candidatus Omnitrophica bacterium]|nr:phosphoribosylformylglycinamidine synthase subunit PurL [Candidatus Omnitrophota bacterium]
MIWRVEIKQKAGVFDVAGAGIQKDIVDLGVNFVHKVEVIQVYNIEGSISEGQVTRICRELFVDCITQEYAYCRLNEWRVSDAKAAADRRAIEIAYNPGVMDPVEESALKGIRDLGIAQVQAVRRARRYLLYGNIPAQDLEIVTSKVLSNKLIQHVVTDPRGQKTFLFAKPKESFALIQVDLLGANDKKLKATSHDGQLFLNLNEMKAIHAHFKKLGRNPTDCELETIAQTWSEHCYHKTFRGNIRYRENGKTKTRLIRNLLKSTIVKATKEINKSWCVSVFHDNAGVIKFDKDMHVCFKVETHNHPSALEPFGGANTGVGGVIRDILGTGLGAKPVCGTDVFCFAPPDMDFAELPPGTLHPKRIMKGVVGGVRDYGNKMGIPTVNGAILFDKRFVGNPLVYCGSVGLIPKNRVRKKVRKGDLIVVVGGKTGRDGIHGATFSSGELTENSEVVSSGAVQIGDPIQEKKVLDALMQARDKNLYTAITDCGAGGLSSAVGEMAGRPSKRGSVLGARVDLDKVPLKYQGLNYDEIWISESQERMVLSVPPRNWKAFQEIFAGENVEATALGEFGGSKRLELFFKGRQVCDLDMTFLHNGVPKITKEAYWHSPKLARPRLSKSVDLNIKLREVLSHYNVCSKESVIRQYDHEVQGASVIKPLAGARCDGPSDASVLAPRLGSVKGIAISNGINVRYGMIDPCWMAASCIDEAIRQIIAVGGDIRQIAILDNFCWGNPDKPDRLGGLVRAAEGCYKAAAGYKVPFISGKDSLYNEYTQNGKSLAIPGTLLISAIGIIADVTKTVTMDFKNPGNLIYCAGKTYDELGGSIYLDTFGLLGNAVPKVNFQQGNKIFTAVSKAVKSGLVRSAHDCSEGGLGAALAEMAFSGGYGATIRLDKVPYKGKDKRNDTVLFAESNSRLILEVEPGNQKKFERLFQGSACAVIGVVDQTPGLVVYGLAGEVCIHSTLDVLKQAWQRPLQG